MRLQEAPELLTRNAFHAMGCEMQVVMAGQPEQARAALEAVPLWFEEWEQALSRFRIDSELSGLNRSPDQFIKVSETLWQVYTLAVWAEKYSGGLVTPAIAEALVRSGYDRSFELVERLQPGREAPSWVEVPALSGILADPHEQSLCLPPGISLDFGGLAKGWAAHEAMNRLRGSGPVLVDAGGDIAISGLMNDQLPWPVGLADPFHPGDELLVLHLPACGVATSGKDRRRWLRGSRLEHHIIDPRSGLPADTDLLTVTVVAPTLIEAEVAAKTALINGSEAGMARIEELPSLAALFILDNGEIRASGQMKAYL